MKSDGIKLSVLSPCYQDQDCVRPLWERLTVVCRATGLVYEIILVDDGSRDCTWDEIRKICEKDSCVVGVKLSKNHGQQKAMSAGMKMARGERLLTIDSDLQDPPELLPEMMRLMDGGADVVYGQRKARKGVSLIKRGCYKLYYKILSWLADCEIPRDTGDFRLVSRRVLDYLNAMPEQQRFLRGMVSWLGFRKAALLYDRDARWAGESHYTFRKLMQIALDGITSFSIRPLRVATLFGLGLAFAAGLLALFILWEWWIKGIPIQGWTSLILVILTIGSLQLFVLGMIGEYLGRLYIESKHRPLFMVDEVLNAGASLEQPDRL